MAYSLALFDLAGAPVADPAPFASATARWELDGPGSLEVTLREAQASPAWLAGRRRVELRRDGVPVWGGWLLGLEASFDPDEGASWTARALGYAAPLERRFVLSDLVFEATPATTIAWQLVQHVQSQPDGDLGITLGTVVGTAPSLTRRYCAPVNLLEAIDELASREPGGFDWEVDARRRLNMWVGGRGTDRRASVSFGPGDLRETRVGEDRAELATYATAVPPDEGPCSPPPLTRAGPIASGHLRQDVLVDAEDGAAAELEARADHEAKVASRSRLRLEGTYEEGRAPAGFASLELGDTVTARLPQVFGGDTAVRLISRGLSLESRAVHFWSVEFEVVA